MVICALANAADRPGDSVSITRTASPSELTESLGERRQRKESSLSLALFWALLTAMTFGVGDFFIRLGVRNGTPLTGAVVNSGTVLVFFLILGWVLGWREGPIWPAAGWFFLMGAAASGPGRVTFYYSMRRIGVSRATVLITIGPLLSLLFAVAFLGERPSWHAVLGAVTVVVGLASVVSDPAGIRLTPRVTLLGLIPAFFLALTAVFSRLGMQSLPDPIMGSGVSSLGAVLFLLSSQTALPREDRWHAERRGFLYFLGGGFCYCAALYSYHEALGTGSVSFVAPLSFTSPLFSILVARMFAQELEQVTWRLALGAAIVFVGIYLVSISTVG